MTLLSVAPLFLAETEAGRNSILSISEIVCCPCILLQFPNLSNVGLLSRAFAVWSVCNAVAEDA